MFAGRIACEVPQTNGGIPAGRDQLDDTDVGVESQRADRSCVTGERAQQQSRLHGPDKGIESVHSTGGDQTSLCVHGQGGKLNRTR